MIDTIKTSDIKDSVFVKSDNLINRHIIIETKNLKENSFNWNSPILIQLIWPLTIIIILLIFRKSVNQLFANIGAKAKRIKGFGLELELELSELNKETEIIENKTKLDTEYAGMDNKDTFSNSNISQNDLFVGLLNLSKDIERILMTLYEFSDKEIYKIPLASNTLINELKMRKVLSYEVTNLLFQFWNFRNKIVHKDIDYSERELLQFIDIGNRIIKILDNVRKTVIKSQFLHLKEVDIQDPNIDLFIGAMENNMTKMRSAAQRGADYKNSKDLDVLRLHKSDLKRIELE